MTAITIAARVAAMAAAPAGPRRVLAPRRDLHDPFGAPADDTGEI